MGGVRRKKSRKNATIKILRNTRKQKRSVKIEDKVLKEHWDQKKTLQQNLKDLGLAYNANSSIAKLKQRTKPCEEEGDENEEEMHTEETTTGTTAVIAAFEEQAKHGKKHERHISPDEAKFLMGLMKKHKTNYNAMCRDKLNTYQHTAKKLEFKCEGLLASPLYERYKNMFPELVEEKMET